MHYDDRGSGTPLLLIHGFPHDRTLWAPQLDGLSAHLRVIAPDLRGFGAWMDDRAVLTMDDHARDLRQLLDDLGITRAVVCGLSMGGYVALAFAALFPERLRGLVLSNTRAGADTEEARKGRKATADRALTEGVQGLAAELAPKMFSATTREHRPDLVDRVRTMLARQRPQAYAAASLGMAQRPDRQDLLPAIDVPTLVITGSADEMIAPAESHRMAQAIKNATLVEIPDAGHLPNLEAEAAFHAAITGLVTRV